MIVGGQLLRPGGVGRPLTLALLCCGAFSCAAPNTARIRNWKSEPEPIVDPHQRIAFRGFSVLPPQAPGWMIAPPFPSEPGNVTRNISFGRRPDRDSGLHTVVAAVTTVDAGDRVLDSPAAVQKFVEDDFAPAVRRGQRGDGLVSIEATPASIGGASCARYAARFETSHVSVAPGRRFLLDVYGYRCADPSWPRFAIDVVASQRYPDGEQPFALDSELEPFWSSLAFTEERPYFATSIVVGLGPQQLVAAADSIWVAYGEHGLARIDPKTNRVAAQITVGRDPIGVAFAGGNIFVANRQDGTLSRVDPATNQVTATLRVSGKPFMLATAAGSLWMTDEERADLVRLDPASGAVVARIHLGGSPANIEVTDDALWIPLYTADKLVRIDPKTNDAVATVDVPNAPGVIAAAAGSVWVASQQEGIVARVDVATNRVVATIQIFARPSAMVADANGVWVSGYNESTLFRIDARTNRRVGRKLMVGLGPNLMIRAEGALWVSNALSNFVSRIDE